MFILKLKNVYILKNVFVSKNIFTSKNVLILKFKNVYIKNVFTLKMGLYVRKYQN